LEKKKKHLFFSLHLSSLSGPSRPCFCLARPAGHPSSFGFRPEKAWSVSLLSAQLGRWPVSFPGLAPHFRPTRPFPLTGPLAPLLSSWAVGQHQPNSARPPAPRSALIPFSLVPLSGGTHRSAPSSPRSRMRVRLYPCDRARIPRTPDSPSACVFPTSRRAPPPFIKHRQHVSCTYRSNLEAIQAPKL
jgi:hypothetical protein